ncbi:biotin holoenzyme synthetase [Corynebacterium maris DSM 45190]|uniref:biotin--[biotin carboxyl-carrier protein] ligase n=1 Tax=Corynebacterium maris DSM 45190 TaxID=1224163 RepID=S5SSM7_9CORY|nr:biotin--[acetyl-CoA-carboxylase] ligase [Corynebacterium maris]AGS34154.1 biotin holoenzyme synthetase [Corynebacterium maris DSM 45190]
MERVIPTQLADLYPHIDLVESTGSTNADLLAGDAPHGAVLIARHQSAGRGRRGRQWSAPADTQLIFSVLLRVTDVERLGTLTLAAGLAVTDVIAPATLKWPNDVLIDGRKLCGILAEAASGPDGEFTVVVGVGLNHLLTREQLPVPHATSLALEGVDVTREQLTVDVLTALAARLEQWQANDPQLMADYRATCSSIGQDVRLEAPTGNVEGTVIAVADDGRIIIDGEAFAAGDVTHLRLRGQ